MRYYIADPHFFHTGVIAMDGRSFGSVEEMDEHMVRQWNSRVRRNDEVVILGDLSTAKGAQTNELLKRLKGRKYLIIGNHDRFLDDKDFDHSLLTWEGHYREMADDGRKVVLSHYPIAEYNGMFRRDKDGKPKAYMLYGHIHNTPSVAYLDHYVDFVKSFERPVKNGSTETAPISMVNCFCLYSDYIPLTLDEWLALEQTRRSSFPYRAATK